MHKLHGRLQLLLNHVQQLVNALAGVRRYTHHRLPPTRHCRHLQCSCKILIVQSQELNVVVTVQSRKQPEDDTQILPERDVHYSESVFRMLMHSILGPQKDDGLGSQWRWIPSDQIPLT